MIAVSVLYPNQPGLHFDINYYCTKHIPLVQELVGSALLKAHVEHGIGGMQPGAPAPYLAIGQLFFESVEAFQKAFGPHLARIVADVPNYTNASPVIQISEVKM
jgi:uncharacterized protein (TIGR02118 family)